MGQPNILVTLDLICLNFFNTQLTGDGHEFGYVVNEKDAKFSHAEASYPGQTVGVYEVIQPDGRERTVRYTADDIQGFVANVSYSTPDGYLYSNRYQKIIYLPI